MMSPANDEDASGDWLTISAAARELEMSRLKLSGLAIAGEVKADSRAGMTFISRASIEAYKLKYPDTYAPKKKGSKK